VEGATLSRLVDLIGRSLERSGGVWWKGCGDLGCAAGPRGAADQLPA
jgi:hypothetical protein